MFFRQVLYHDLGCASYVLGDAGEAIVVDPRWDIDAYLQIAAAERLSIVHVIDTHEHADHVSGRERLVAATGARGHRPAAPDPAEPQAADRGAGAPATAIVAAGDTIDVGALRLTALASPGHRPEHLSFAVADLSRGPEPWLLLTGDSLLVGDVARPDLAYEPAEGAAALHATLARLLALGDGVELWPAHVGGSLCGGAGLSHKTSSTIGYERRHNPLLSLARTDFVRGVTASLPSRPPNIERVVALNRRVSGAFPAEPGPVSGAALLALLADDVTVLDSRSPADFDAGHLAGAVNLPVASPGVGTRAGWALAPDGPLIVVARDEQDARRTASALQAVGFWDLAGAVIADPRAWTEAGLPVATSRSWDVDRLAGGLRADEVDLVDVRELAEWLGGHVAGSHHVPLNRLRDVASVPTAPSGRVTAVACAAGVRAAFAASLLRRAGRADVVRVAGGGVADLGSRGIELALGA